MIPETTFATVHGSPGARVRALGLAATYGPFLAALFVAGWLLHAALPVPIPPAAAGAALMLVVLGAWAALGRAGRRYRSYLKGARGEEIVARELSLLPEDWTVFHGVARGGLEAMCGGGDFDHVVLGPGALYVVETKNWAGPVRLEGATVSAGGATASRSPVAQVRREANALRRRLKRQLPPEMPVRGVVCFASNGLERDRMDVDGTPLCNVRELRALLLAGKDPSIGPERRRLLVEALLAAPEAEP